MVCSNRRAWCFCFLFQAVLLVFTVTTSAGDRTTAYCAEAPENMLSWWNGNDTSEDVFGDSDGVLVNGAGFAQGVVDRAFSFDGQDDYVEIPEPNVAGFGTDPFTVVFWINADGLRDSYHYIMGRSDGSAGQGWEILQYGSTLQVWGVDGWAANITTEGILSVGDWHLVALSADGLGNDVVLYFDGNPVGTSTRGNVGWVSTPLRFGMTTNFTGTPFCGRLDEIQIYERALTRSEVEVIFASGGGGLCQPCAAVPQSTMAWWRAEDDADDEKGVFYGVLEGDTSFVQGVVGQAFSFDGSDDFVELPYPEEWDFEGGSFSVSAWFRTGTAGYGNIIRYDDGSGTSGRWGIRVEPSGKVETLMAGQGGNPAVTLTSLSPVVDGQWHLVTAVRDAAAGQIRLYVDGSSAASPVSDFSMDITGGSGNRALIGAGGRAGGGTFEPFTGDVDELIVVTGALSEEEVQRLYAAGSLGFCTGCGDIPEGLISWWRAEDSAVDDAGPNDGVSVGVTYTGGRVGNAFLFGPGDEYVEVGDDPSLDFDPNEPMSIDFWAYRTGSATSQHILGKRSGCDGGPFNYQIVLDSGAGGLCFSGNNGGVTRVCSNGGGNDLPTDQWTHIAATFDGSTMVLYLNGQEAARGSVSLGTPDDATLRIGTSGTCGAYGQSFEGLIDEVEIHHGALSRNEVYEVYAAGEHGKCGSSPDPFAFTDQDLAAVSTVVTSDSVVITGIVLAAPVSISACTGSSCEYSINGGSWTSDTGTAVNGDSIAVRQTSSPDYGVTTDLTLDVGDGSDTFSVTTLVQHTLTVTLIGDGTGSIGSTPAGIDCPATACSASFDETAAVELSAVADPGSVFTGWSGDGDCLDGEVSMGADVGCTARFSTYLFIDGFESGGTEQWDVTSP